MGTIDEKLLKPIGTLAAVLSLIQGLLWTVLSILAILVYHGKIDFPTNENTDSFLIAFVALYFNGGTGGSLVKGVTSADDVLIWMCVYLGFSVIWAVTCVIWLVDLHRKGRPLISLYLWCGATICILVLDLTATIWFGTDLASMREFVNTATGIKPPLFAGKTLELLLAPALMMTMAARGFVLYLVNTGLLAIVSAIAVKSHRQKAVSSRAAARKISYVNPGMNPAWPERDNTLRSMGTWGRGPPTREAPRYPTYVNPPMSPAYDDMPPRSQPPFLLKDPPKPLKPRAAPQPPREEAPKYNIPEPDYSPVMSRAYPQPMLPLRPALKKTSPHIGRTVF